MSDKDGGAAFPRNYVPGSVTTDGSGRQYHTPFTPAQEGMTLRDYFAAKAMQGFCAGAKVDDDVDAIPELSYAMADMMLEVRGKL